MNPANLRLLEALRAGRPSASELALTLNLPLSKVHYLLEQLVDAGVAEVVEVERRAGRPIRRYRMERDWYVPFEVTPASTLEELVGGQARALMDRFTHGLMKLQQDDGREWGFRLVYSETHGLSLGITDVHGEQPFREEPVMATWVALRLPRVRAQELRSRLEALLHEFDEPGAEGAEPFTVGMFLAPGRLV